MKITFKNIIIYLLGLILISLAVTLMLKTHLGMGAWDAVIANLQSLLKIDLGYASLIVNLVLLSLVIIYKKSFKYITVIVPILINMFLLNIWDGYIFNNLVLNTMTSRVLVFLISTILLPLGLSLVIMSTLPKMIYDELTFILIDIFKAKHFGIVRLGFEVFAILLAILLGALNNDVFSQIGIGTIIVTSTIGTLIELYLKIFKFKKDDLELDKIEKTTN